MSQPNITIVGVLFLMLSSWTCRKLKRSSVEERLMVILMMEAQVELGIILGKEEEVDVPVFLAQQQAKIVPVVHGQD